MAVALNEYGEFQDRALRDIDANVPDDQLTADFEALNRSAAKLGALCARRQSSSR
ncbi:MAG TPA: hypothetical protein VGU66_14195 [Candidatus Elarobacter sp.]|nr:hypothetical protein [Candidatus Elarobacter sp.]